MLIDDVKQNVASDWSQILCTGILQALIFGGMGAGCTGGKGEMPTKILKRDTFALMKLRMSYLIRIDSNLDLYASI